MARRAAGALCTRFILCDSFAAIREYSDANVNRFGSLSKH